MVFSVQLKGIAFNYFSKNYIASLQNLESSVSVLLIDNYKNKTIKKKTNDLNYNSSTREMMGYREDKQISYN